MVNALRTTAALALPPRCPGCATPGEADHRFCAACWNTLRFIAPPWCAACHVPFAFDRGADARCGRCLASPPRHAGVNAAVAYGAVSRDVAIRLKHGGRIALAETMARQIVRLVPPEVDLLVPVPLHRWRIWTRGFNQAALIASALAKPMGLTHDPAALERIRRTQMLRGLSAKQRSGVVRAAFRVPDPSAVAGRSIGLVDDVFTTGATADACTRALLRAGARSVTILCWARVLPEDADD